MKTKEEIAALIEDIFKNAERIHGNSKALDWIKVASSETVNNLWYEDIIRLDNADQFQSEVMPSDSILDDLKQYITNMLYYAYKGSNIIPSKFDFWAEEMINGIDEYFKSQLKPAEKEEKNVVYEALYNPMIHESAYTTLSIHKTRKGAEMAIAFHEAEMIKEDEKDSFMKWSIRETKIEE